MKKHKHLPLSAWIISITAHVFLVSIIVIYSFILSIKLPFFSGNDKPYKMIRGFVHKSNFGQGFLANAELAPGLTYNGNRIKLESIVYGNTRGKVNSCDNLMPAYPVSALREGKEGLVILSVKVSEKGIAKNVSIKKSSGHKILDEAAKRAVSSWRFFPAFKDGKPKEGNVTVPIKFGLKEKR